MLAATQAILGRTDVGASEPLMSGACANQLSFAYFSDRSLVLVLSICSMLTFRTTDLIILR